jgi:RNA 3'-terminal phosphate cyclase (ATP)
VVAIVANLPRGIAQREIDTIANLLNWGTERMEIVETKNSIGPGNIALIELATSTGVTELFCGFGRLGASAESVAAEAVKEARAYMVSEAAVGKHLADQLLLPFALGRRRRVYCREVEPACSHEHGCHIHIRAS